MFLATRRDIGPAARHQEVRELAQGFLDPRACPQTRTCVPFFSPAVPGALYLNVERMTMDIIVVSSDNRKLALLVVMPV